MIVNYDVNAGAFRVRPYEASVMPSRGLTAKEQQTFEEYTDRANGIGRPLTDIQKNKLADLQAKQADQSPTPGQTTLCWNWVLRNVYGYRPNKGTQAMRRGIETEPEALEIIADYLGVYNSSDPDIKTEQDDVFRGRADWPFTINGNLIVVDAKSKQDMDSFKAWGKGMDDGATQAKAAIELKAYTDQINCYLKIYGDKFGIAPEKRHGLVCGVLVNTPPDMVTKLANQAAVAQGYEWGECPQEIYEQVLFQHTYDDLPISHRVNPYWVKYNPDRIEEITREREVCVKLIGEMLDYVYTGMDTKQKSFDLHTIFK